MKEVAKIPWRSSKRNRLGAMFKVLDEDSGEGEISVGTSCVTSPGEFNSQVASLHWSSDQHLGATVLGGIFRALPAQGFYDSVDLTLGRSDVGKKRSLILRLLSTYWMPSTGNITVGNKAYSCCHGLSDHKQLDLQRRSADVYPHCHPPPPTRQGLFLFCF